MGSVRRRLAVDSMSWCGTDPVHLNPDRSGMRDTRDPVIGRPVREDRLADQQREDDERTRELMGLEGGTCEGEQQHEDDDTPHTIGGPGGTTGVRTRRSR
jgi:hypothetical protein